MQHIIHPLKKGLRGTLNIPGDKSVSHRSVIFGSIAHGLSEVENFLNGEDCICTRKAFEAMGVQIENPSPDRLIIHGQGIQSLKASSQALYLGNSGTAMRLLTGLCAGLSFSSQLTGDASLSSRPMKRVIDPLSQMGALISSIDGHAPLTISPHPLKGIRYHSPIASAQVKSAILLAGLNANGPTIVSEDHKSRDHTELMLKSFGADISIDGLTVSINAASKLLGQKFRVPSDISSAAFFIVGACLVPNSKLELSGIGINPTRTGILDVLVSMGVDIQVYNTRLEGQELVADININYSPNLRATNIQGDIIPRLIDEIPIIAVLAAQASGTTIIKDAQELKVKESNRIDSTVSMLKALGVRVEATEDGMLIEGNAGEPFRTSSNIIDSKGDHRIAMSSAIAALYADQPIQILETEFVDTSFPGFFSKLEAISQS